MKELRCMVVDDEPLAVKMLENFISKTSFLSLEASFTDPVAALEAIRAQRPQLGRLRRSSSDRLAGRPRLF